MGHPVLEDVNENICPPRPLNDPPQNRGFDRLASFHLRQYRKPDADCALTEEAVDKLYPTIGHGLGI